MERCIRLEARNSSAEARRIPQLASCFWCGRMHRAENPLSICLTCVGKFRTMRLREMRSYPLDAQSIDEVMSHTSPGNYALGYMNGGVFESDQLDNDAPPHRSVRSMSAGREN